MKNENKLLKTHYLNFSYECLISHKVIQYILFLIEVGSIFLQILEIYYNEYKSLKSDNIKIFSYITPLIRSIKKINIAIQFLIYVIIIILITMVCVILNFLNLSKNIFWTIIVNINEIIFYRIGSLIIFHYLFSFNDIYLIFGFILTIPYILILISGFSIHHLFTFFFHFVKYPYDSFSKIIDIYLLFVKIFLSISAMAYGNYLSKFFFILSLFILFFLQIYLTYIMFYKSYFLMNNISLNKTRYSILLSNCFIILLVMITKNKELSNIYFIICFANVLILSFLLIIIFYDPYQFIKFGKDDCEENPIYYFFVLDRNKNQHLLLENKIEEHVSKCGRCNLCKKYKKARIFDKFENIDLYNIIYNNKNYGLNLMNKIIREIRKNGKASIANNSYYLINLIYIYYVGVMQNDYCFFLNTELLYQLVNKDNIQYIEDYQIYLNKIKLTNNFITKAKEILDTIYKVLNEKNTEKKYEIIFKLGILLEQLKFKEIKNNCNNMGNYSNGNNGHTTDKTLNWSNILTVCSLFYEELYNESISNSRIYIRDSQNLIDDLINNNLKNQRLITLEITAQNFLVKIIRAGGFLNKYENNSLLDLFPEVFKNDQIALMKKLLLNSNSDFQNDSSGGDKTNKNSRNRENEYQYITFNFIIEQKDENNIYYQHLKLDLYFVILKTMSTIFYLNGLYKIDKDIIITEQSKQNEYLYHFGNKDQIHIISDKYMDNKIQIKKMNGHKYLGNKKLNQDTNIIIFSKRYKAYHFSIQTKKNDIIRLNKNVINQLTEETIDDKDNSENKDKLIFNDVASQSSSLTSSISRSNLTLLNRGNKQTQNDEDITKNFKTIKYFLWFFILLILFTFIIEYIVLNLYHSSLVKEVEFYLSLSKYYIIYSRIFCAIISLSCIGISPEGSECFNGIRVFSDYQIIINNLTTIENMGLSPEESLGVLISHFFVNFKELLFNQEQIMYYLLEATKDRISDLLVDINQNNFNNYFETNLTYHKINQNLENNEFKLSIKKEKLPFNDAILLITSRCAILSKNLNDSNYPIYILNKFDEKDIFKNIYLKNKLNAYQENFYLLLLDHNEFITYLNETISKVEKIVSDKVNSFKKYIYIILLTNGILYLIIFTILLGYIAIYLIIIFQILKNIYTFLNEKLDNVVIKDIFRKKIDNLKLILSFYEKDISSTINDLNDIYHKYKESYNLKLKEESKHVKRESFIEKEKEIPKKKNLFKLIKCQYFSIFFTYSSKKRIYKNSAIFIIIFVIVLFVLYIVILITFLIKQNKVLSWVELTKGLSASTNLLMTNFLMMTYTNQTFTELSSKLPQKDFSSFIYDKLTDLYKAGGLLDNVQSLFEFSEKNIEYDCNKFYLNLNYPYFNLLLDKYKSINSTTQLYFTLSFFCQTSNVMEYKNYKAVYMQLFNPIINIMQIFKSSEYSEIMEFIVENNIAGLEVFFFVTYVYLLDIMNQNVIKVLGAILDEMKSKIQILGIIFLIAFIHLITSIYLVFTRNINKDCNIFIQMKKIFKVYNNNE